MVTGTVCSGVAGDATNKVTVATRARKNFIGLLISLFESNNQNKGPA